MERMTKHGGARRVLIAATFLIVAATLQGEDADFRQLRWGMTIEEVKEIEGAPDYETPEALLYDTRVGGVDAHMIMYFEDGGFYQAVYAFQEDRVNYNNYLRDFEKIGRLLRQVYGEPSGSDNHHDLRGSLYRDDRDYWGLAVATGQLAILSGWETDRTRIIHSIDGENYEVNHRIGYTTTVEDEERERRLREAETEGL